MTKLGVHIYLENLSSLFYALVILKDFEEAFQYRRPHFAACIEVKRAS